MASCITSQWVSSAPQIKLTVVENSSTATTSTLKWTLEYIASSAASTSVAKSYSVVVNGSTVGSGTYNINNKKGTYTIATNTLTINKTTAAQSISFSCSMDINIKWSGVSKSTISASGSISVPAKTSYKITYNANGGSSTPSAQTKWHGTNITLAGAISRTGYSFGGWNTNSSGTGTNYSAGGTYSTNASATLYAKWTANTFTVSYNANGGSGAPGNQTKTYGVDLTLSTTKPTRTNYNFKGWATSASGSGSVAYQPGGTYTANAAITLYAIWELAYTKPRIKSLTVRRCNWTSEDGYTLADDGTYALVEFDWETDQKMKSVLIQWKLSTDSGFSDNNKLEVGVQNFTSVHAVVSGTLDADYIYDFRITVTDEVDYAYKDTILPGTEYIIDILHDGTGMAIGKAATLSNTFDVYKRTIIRGNEDASGTKESGQFIIGDPNGYHLAMDNNEIMAKENGTTPSTLTLNYEGGDVGIGNNNYKVSLHGDVTITSPTAGLNSRQYGVNKVLWSGSWYMHGTQTATLTESVSGQPHGIVLVFSRFVDGAAMNYDFVSHFVPKGIVAQGTWFHTFALAAIGFSTISTKFLKIANTTIVGDDRNDDNGSSSGTGVTFQNSGWVLRYVFGV